MRHISATAVLLVFVLGLLAPACVAGWNGSSYELSAKNCQEVPQLSAGMRCVRHRLTAERNRRIASHESRAASRGTRGSEVVHTDEACADAFKARPGQCGLRSFIQLHFVSIQTAEISIPLLVASKVPSPSRVVIVVSSVGPPETDRGPPRC